MHFCNTSDRKGTIVMTYISTVKTADEARANIRKGLRTLEQNERQKTRIVADLATSLADLLTFTPDESRDYNGAKEILRGIVSDVVPQNAETGKPENSLVTRMMSSAADAIRLAMLILNGDKTGFVSGYVRNDASDYVDAATFAGMKPDAQKRHSREVFWNRSKTFPRMKLAGTDVASPTDFVMPTVDEMKKAYKRHFEAADLNSDRTGLKPAERPEGDGIQTNGQLVKAVAEMKAWLKAGNLLSADDKQTALMQGLADAIDKGIAARADALGLADEMEAAESQAA